jgi:mannose-1-phosphate guanylyltransferase
MMAVQTALIVAGGKGTRLQPLTHDVAKPLVPFCGEPFLAGVIRRLAEAGVDHVLLVVGDDTEPFQSLDPLAQRLGIRLEPVPEPEPLDTAGGVRSVSDRFTEPVLVLNGDILTNVDYEAVASHHLASGADATIVLTEVSDTSSYGVAVREGSRIVAFVEKPEPGTLPGHRTVNAGTYVLHPSVLHDFPEGPLSFERDVFPTVLDRGAHIEGFVWDGVWQDLGTPERYREGHRLALDGELAWPAITDVPVVSPGVRVVDSAAVGPTARIEAPVLILAGARIAAAAVVGPHAVVGQGSMVGPGATVREGSVLHDGVQIGEGVEAVGLLAGTGARVEAGAHLGRDVVLGAGETVPAGERVADEERRPPPRDL